MEAEFQEEFWTCSFLEDPQNEFRKREQLTQKNLKILSKKAELFYQRVVDNLESGCPDRRLAEVINNSRRLKREKETAESKFAKHQADISNIHKELATLHTHVDDKNIEVLNEAQRLDDCKTESVRAEKELEKKRVDLKRRYDAILLVKDEYKKLLGFHIRLLSSDDSGDTYVVTFDHALKVKFDGNAIPSRSVKLVQSSINKSWKLLETNPCLSNFSRIVAEFEKSEDTRGLMVYLRDVFRSRRIK